MLIDFVSHFLGQVEYNENNLTFKEIRASKSEIIEALEVLKQWKFDISDEASYVDVIIEKELKRRNINVSFGVVDSKNLSFIESKYVVSI